MPTILVVAASPVDLDRLRLGNEVKQIKRALERSRNRENWSIETNEAVTVDDLRRALLDFRPTVVHFSGHGGGSAGLAFEDDSGNTHAAQTAPLARLFHNFKDSLKCVLLNACYSEVQAKGISHQIDYVIGMSKGIGDDSATKFAVAFYDAVFAETTFRQAFDLACTSIDLSNLPDFDVPVFLTGPSIGNETLSYTALIPQFEDFLLRYLNSHFDQRYQLATKGESLKEKMKSFYSTQLQTVYEKVTVVSTRQIDAEHWKTRSLLQVKNQSLFADHFLRVRDRSIQIEWEASTGHWSMPPKAYLALGTAEPIIARVHASLGTSYFGDFRDKERNFQNIELRTKNSESLHGYVRRHSPEGIQIINLLSDGNEHDVTISILNVSDETDHPLILAVVSESWVIPEVS